MNSEQDPHQQIAPSSILALFSALGDVYFFMKDREGRFIGANQLQLEKLGLKREAELIGKTDFDFFPSYMITRYADDDAQVERFYDTHEILRHP